jgi:hypothetical protein
VFVLVVPLAWALVDMALDQGAHAEYLETYGALPPAGAAGARLLDQNFRVNPEAELDYAYKRLSARRVRAADGSPDRAGLEDEPVAVGRILDERRKPLAGSLVTLWNASGDALQATLSGSDGSFSLAWHHPLEPGWWVGAEPDTGELPCLEETLAPTARTITAAHAPGDPPVITELMMGRPRELMGVVLDERTREPVAGARVSAVSPHGPWSEQVHDALTGRDGRFTICAAHVPGRDLRVAATDGAGRTCTLDANLDLNYDLTLVLVESGALQGTVFSEVDGQPVQGAKVMLVSALPLMGGSAGWDLTDADGSWSIAAAGPPGQPLQLHVSEPGHGAVLVSARAGDGSHALLLPAVPEVTGVVASQATGEPLAHTLVSLVVESPGQGLAEDLAFTDAEGRFVLEARNVPVDVAELQIWAPGLHPVRRSLSGVRTGPDGTLLVEITSM